MVGPPRTGKNTMIAFQADAAASKGACVVCWAHKTELVGEVLKRLKTQIATKHNVGIIMAGHEQLPGAKIQLMSTATGVRRINKLSWLRPHLIIGDEGHRMLSNGQLNTLLPKWPNARVIAYTATPFRNDGKSFENVFDAIVQITTFQDQIDAKVLVPSVVYHPDVSMSLDGVHTSYGSDGKEYDAEEQEEIITDIKSLEGLYGLWMKRTGGKFQTMCFNVNKKSNKVVCEYMRSKGINAVAIDESTPKDNRQFDKNGNPIGRKQLLEKFYKGPFCDNPIMFLANVALFSEGIDAPTTKCVILNYATLSLSKLIQSSARGSGAMFGPDGQWLIDPRTGRNYKEKVIILDMGNNFIRHKTTLETYDTFGFDLSGKPKKRDAPSRECPSCHILISINCKTCPACGEEMPVMPKEQGRARKVGADEVDFLVLDQDQVTVQRMLDNLKDDASVVKFCHIAWLRINALVNRKGDPVDYARRIILEKYAADPQMCLDAINNGHSHKLDGAMLMEVTGDRKKLEEFLEKREKRHMTFDRFERFKKNMLRL